jgi:hypothetical protein
MFRNLLTVVLGFLLALSAPVHADDLKLKNGKEYKNLTLISESKTSYVFLTEDGARLTIAKSSVETLEKKPTIRGELLEREKALKSRDVDGMYELGVWAKENGLVREGETLLKKVLRVDRNHVKANEALGNEMVNGKWIDAADAAKARAKELEKVYKARGWKEHKGEWMSPAAHHRAKTEMVQVQGHWVTENQRKKIEAENLTWVEGEWYTPEEKARIDAGERRRGGKWKEVLELDTTHRELSNPWIVKGEFVEIRSNARHKDVARVLVAAENAYRTLSDIFGEDHRDLYDDKKGPLIIILGRTNEDYRFLGTTAPRGDRESYRSSGYGQFFAASYEPGRGAACTYYIDQPAHMGPWTAAAVTHGFVARMTDYNKTNERTLDALSGYVAGCDEGRYRPTRSMKDFAIDNKQKPFGSASDLLGRVGYKTDHTLPQAGFFLHFLRTKNDEAFIQFWRQFFLSAGSDLSDLQKACVGEMDSETLNAEFAAFKEDFLKTFTDYRPEFF